MRVDFYCIYSTLYCVYAIYITQLCLNIRIVYLTFHITNCKLAVLDQSLPVVLLSDVIFSFSSICCHPLKSLRYASSLAVSLENLLNKGNDA